MKEYLQLCLEGESSIPKRKIILDKKKEACFNRSKSLRRPSILLIGNKISMMMSYLVKQNIIPILFLNYKKNSSNRKSRTPFKLSLSHALIFYIIRLIYSSFDSACLFLSISLASLTVIALGSVSLFK